MFFIFSKVLGPLIRPLPFAFLLLLLSALLAKRSPRAARWAFWVGVLGLYLMSTQPVADLLAMPLERPYATRTGLQPTEAIVVLNGMLDLQLSSPGEAELVRSGDRIIDAVILARKWPNATLIISGGSSSMLAGSTGEGELLRRLAMDLGVPDERIVVEPSSRNTRESAVAVRKLLEAQGIGSFVLVTSATHMRRSMGCFRAAGLEPGPYAVDFIGRLSGKGEPFRFAPSHLIPSPDCLVHSSSAVQEYIGYAMYRLAGYV